MTIDLCSWAKLSDQPCSWSLPRSFSTTRRGRSLWYDGHSLCLTTANAFLAVCRPWPPPPGPLSPARLGDPHPRYPHATGFGRCGHIHRDCDDQQQQEEGGKSQGRGEEEDLISSGRDSGQCIMQELMVEGRGSSITCNNIWIHATVIIN